MLVDDVNIHVKGDVNEVEEKVKPIRAKLTNDVGLLQLEMSGTEKGKDDKTNMLLHNSILGSRFQTVGATKRDLELYSLLRTRGAQFRGMWKVSQDGGGAHEHMGVQKQSKRHAIAETRELVHGHEGSTG